MGVLGAPICITLENTMRFELPAGIDTVNISFMAMTDEGSYWEAPTWSEVSQGEWMTYPKTKRRIELTEVV